MFMYIQLESNIQKPINALISEIQCPSKILRRYLYMYMCMCACLQVENGGRDFQTTSSIFFLCMPAQNDVHKATQRVHTCTCRSLQQAVEEQMWKHLMPKQKSVHIYNVRIIIIFLLLIIVVFTCNRIRQHIYTTNSICI